MNPKLSEIHRAVELEVKCRASHLESRVVTVKPYEEPFTRAVETFTLQNHGTARRAYAWPKSGDGTKADQEYMIILGGIGINSAEDALASVLRAIMRAI